MILCKILAEAKIYLLQGIYFMHIKKRRDMAKIIIVDDEQEI